MTIEGLVTFPSDEAPAIGQFAARTLAWIRLSVVTTVIPALLDATANPHPELRAPGIRGLGLLGASNPTVRAALRSATGDRVRPAPSAGGGSPVENLRRPDLPSRRVSGR